MGMFPCLLAVILIPFVSSCFDVWWGRELIVGLTLGTLGLFLKSVTVIVLRMDTYVVRGTSPFARTGFVCISCVCVFVPGRFCLCLFWGGCLILCACLFVWQWGMGTLGWGGDAEKMMIFETKSQALRDLV